MTDYTEVENLMLGGSELDALFEGEDLLWPTSYVQALMRDNPLLIWLMNDTGGIYADSSGQSRTGTYSGATHNAGGPLEGYLTYDGDDFGSGAVDLSAFKKITVEFWLWWDEFSNADQVLLEYTPDSNLGDGFLLNPNASVAMDFEFGCTKSGRYRTSKFPRPTSAAWHHYSLVLDRDGDDLAAMVDGVVQTVTVHTSNADVGNTNFANSSLFVMARNNSIAPGHGRMAGLVIYGGELSEGRRRSHHTVSR